MQQLIAITRKEFLLWAQKPGNWVVVFLIPLLFAWIISAVFGGSGGIPAVTVYAVDVDQSEISQRVMDALRDAGNLTIEELDSRAEADRRVGTGERMAAIVLPEGFGEAVATDAGGKIEIIIDPARAQQANIVVGLVNAAVGPLIVDAEVSRAVERGVGQILQDLEPTATLEPSAALRGVEPEPTATATPTPEPSPTPEEPLFEEDDGEEDVFLPEPEPTEADLSAVDPETLRSFLIAAIKGVVGAQVQEVLDDPQVQLRVEPYQLPEQVRRPTLLNYLVPGYSVMFVFFLISSLATQVVEERETGALRRLLSTPVPRSRILLGKLLPYTLLAVAQMIFVLLLSRFLFGVDLKADPVALAMVMVSTAFAMAGLGILVAALAKSTGQADGIATILTLAMAVISGAMFPTITLPGIRLATPHYWAMQGFLNVTARGEGVMGALLPAGVLMIMAVVFFTLGAIRFRFD